MSVYECYISIKCSKSIKFYETSDLSTHTHVHVAWSICVFACRFEISELRKMRKVWDRVRRCEKKRNNAFSLSEDICTQRAHANERKWTVRPFAVCTLAPTVVHSFQYDGSSLHLVLLHQKVRWALCLAKTFLISHLSPTDTKLSKTLYCCYKIRIYILCFKHLRKYYVLQTFSWISRWRLRSKWN